ncbi:ATP-binding protein [Fulvivirga sp. RKSG066]|uniref:ATP-binding protein n=1 Tax=Fulvivirga aurantia TaxID=2529383 RepID=UPI0012BB8F5D|nr:ATP-binding protein [Fulvivirga aurantia]MTI20245.1 ATP-binding protein [Fulvivirga aurantia]
MHSKSSPNTQFAQIIAQEISLVENLVKSIMRSLLKADGDASQYQGIISKLPSPHQSYDRFLVEYKLQDPERLAIATALTATYKPQAFDSFLLLNPATNSPFTELGGYISGSNLAFSPTFQTVIYMIAGDDLAKTVTATESIGPQSKLFAQRILTTHSDDKERNWKNFVVKTSEEFFSILQGAHYKPSFSSEFPAARIQTKMAFEDLILDFDTEQKVLEIDTWLKHGQKVMQHSEFGKRVKPGYKAMFYGPSGTGKTLTATMLGKKNNLDVYRVDLSMLVSKWVGETEKNLKGVFDMAEDKNWILFFDEADSIFGKRTQTQSSNDRYANQEVSYLLQRIEEYPGLVILATNLKANIDAAFHRRLNNIIYFPPPNEEHRIEIWQKTLPSDFVLDKVITMEELGKIDLSGGEILNVTHYCLLKSYERNDKLIAEEDMTYAIRKELEKKGKVHK